MSWLFTIVFVGMMLSNSPQPAGISSSVMNTGNTGTFSVVSDETERLEKSYPLNANGRVSVSNVNGNVTVTAWDRNEVKLIAIKTADTKEHLDDVDIKIESRPDLFSVESDYDRNRGAGQNRIWGNDSKGVSVEYQLTVPRGAVLNEIETVNGSVTVSDFTNVTKVSAVNGTVRAGNLRGTADLSTVNGEVIADFDQLAAGSKINLDTVNGRVTLTLPSDANATVKADSLNGPITNDFGLPNRRGKYVGNSLHGRLGAGEVPIKLESVNGSLTVKRRNDGRPQSPATNLLPPKGADEDEWDADGSAMAAKVARVNRDTTRAVTQAQRQAMIDARREMAKIKPEFDKVTKETMKEIEKSVDTAKITAEVRDSLLKQRAALPDLRNANFMFGVPRVESKGDAIAVKGTPKITIDAKSSAVRIRGWDRQEVQYSFSRFRNGDAAADASVTETHTDSSVTIKVTENRNSTDSMFEGPPSRIDIFVPRRSNLKIVSGGEIRLEGVSGELEVTGGAEPVNIRDSEGKLNITTGGSRARIIGFNGDVTALTTEGELYLEGNFDNINAKAVDGTIVLTLPDGANADFAADADAVGSEGFDLVRRGDRSLRLGAGGPKYNFGLTDARLIVRNATLISK